MIHFNAVDWKCVLYINEIKIGEHTGGYTDFYFDITKSLNDGINNIILKVWDPSDKGYQPVGKQTLNPNSIWYTSISGIWQTVWLEPVNDKFIKKLEINNDFDNKEIKINFKTNCDEKLPLTVSLIYNKEEILNLNGISNTEIIFKIPDKYFHPWSPIEPNIYIIKVQLLNESKNLIDSISSYTTIRKVEQKKMKKDIIVYL